MRRGLSLAAAIVGVSAFLSAGTARAQWGYGGYGWGGWGGGTTVLGDQARGMGMYAAGLGQYNVNTAQARSINTDTAIRFNEYVYQSQQIRNHRYWLDVAQKKDRLNKNLKAIHTRLVENPTDADITSGDALNVILDQLTEPKVFKRAVRMAKAHLSPHMIRDIPFNYASEAVTIAIDEMTSQEDWPSALRGKDFTPEREAYAKIIDEAVKEDDKGNLSPETIQKAKDAVTALWNKVEKTLPAGTPTRRAAENHVKALAAMTKMLESPNVSAMLAGVDKYGGATVGDLLAFMHSFNLRFGAANTPRQKALYRDLFPILDQTRDEVIRRTNVAANTIPDAPPNPDAVRPTEFFKDADWQAVDPKRPPTPPAPANNP